MLRTRPVRRVVPHVLVQENTMATLLYRLGKTAYRRWPAFIAAWLVALIGFAALAGAIHKPRSTPSRSRASRR